MSNPLISIIVPVYKAEKYLNRCVESIVNQTYKNLEIILVDDGSPDNCPQMCDEWAEKDGRIKVIHKENGGAAMARNAALDTASGDYIGFVDSDDWIACNMYEVLYNSLIENDSDISMCRHFDVDAQSAIKEIDFYFSEEAITGKDCIVLGKYSAVNCVLWNKLYKKELWQNIRFPNYMKYEDEAVLPYIYNEAKKIACVQAPLYYYVYVDGSIMNSQLSDNDLVMINIMEKRLEFFSGTDIYLKILSNCLNVIRGLLVFHSNEPKGFAYIEITKFFRRILKISLKQGVKMSFRARISYIACYISPSLYSRLINLL